jgi:G3E family GTPase
MIDAGAFLADFAAMRGHFEAQARLASLVVLNKTDLVGDAERATVRETLQQLQPGVRIVEAVYGAVPEAALNAAFRGDPLVGSRETAEEPHDRHDHGHDADHGHAHRDHGHDHGDDHHHDHGADALGFSSWNAPLAPHCDAEALAKVLDAAVAGHFGQVARLKGLARVGKGWIQFDVAGGKKSMTAFAANGEETARVVAIGNALDAAGLDAAFAGCALGLAA